MELTAYKLSSFAKDGRGGNPAGVVLESDNLTEAQMKYVAKRIGYSETAFVSKSEEADFKVRFFTPSAEVDLCGHATIAVFSLLKQRNLISRGNYTQETKAGILRLSIDEETIFMEQARPEFSEIIPYEELYPCLGISLDGFEQSIPVQVVSTGLRDIIVPVKDRAALENLMPDMKKIEEISSRYNATGLHVFTIGNSPDSAAVCRNFAPLYGIPEESATGTANAALTCYLYRYGKLKVPVSEINIEQGSFMGRLSIIRALLKVQAEKIEEVWVGGNALIIGEEAFEV